MAYNNHVNHNYDNYMGVSENVVYPIVPNGFADHYPYEKWLFHWEYTLFSDKPIFMYIWAISKTLGSWKGHPQIWEGPIAYHTFVQ